MSVDNRARRLMELKDAVKAFFEVTGAVGGGWTEAFRAVRRNEDMAESFVGELRELLSYIEREFSARRPPDVIEPGPEARTTVRRAAQAMVVESDAPGDDLFAEPARTPPSSQPTGRSRPPSPPPGPRPASEARRGSRDEVRAPLPPAIAYGPTGATTKPPAEPPQRSPHARTAPYIAAREPPAPPAPAPRSPSSKTVESRALSASGSAPATARAASSSSSRSAPPASSSSSGSSSSPSPRAASSRASSESQERTNKVERVDKRGASSVERGVDKTNVSRAPSRVAPPPPVPRRFVPNDDFDGATRVDSLGDFGDLERGDEKTGRTVVPSGKPRR